MARHIHKELKKYRSSDERMADAIAGFVGSMKFVYAHTLWFAVWALLNMGLIGGGFIFDEYPFSFLTFVVSLEAIFLSTFVLISQNRQAKISELRSERDYDTDVKAEKEIEVIMATLERISNKLDVDISDLSEDLRALHREEAELIEREHKAENDVE